MRIETDPKLDFRDVLIRPKRSTLRSRSEVDLNRTFVFPYTARTWTGVPIIAANMDTVGTTKMAIALAEFGCMTALHKHHGVREIEMFQTGSPFDTTQNCFYSIGILDADLDKYRHYPYRPNNKVCIDVANGYSEGFVEFIKRFREEFPDTVIMAGNVVTGEMAEELILSGVDIVKVGIGPGSVCLTRKMTGVGYPQLSAIIECADAAHGVKGLVCADGGCTVPGDLAKAFGAGADFVMLGGMLAGHNECNGEITNTTTVLRDDVEILEFIPGSFESPDKYRVSFQGNEYEIEGFGFGFPVNPKTQFLLKEVPTEQSAMKFYGMSSKEAQEKHNGGVKEYRASEGKCVEVPYRGPVADTMKEILGGIRSACTYVGAEKLKELSKRTTFVMVHQQINEIFGKS